MNNEVEDLKKVHEPFQLYKARWVVLFLSAAASAISNMQWMQYGIIADVLVFYYGLSYSSVNWSSMIFLLVYFILVFPMSYILDKHGLRTSMLIGVVLTAVGAWIKVGSIAPDRYWVLLLGQFIVAVGVVPLMGLIPKVAATWFGPKEVSTACGIGLAGLQLGFAVGFAVPPEMITSENDMASIKNDFTTISIGVGIISTILMMAVLLWFPDRPKTPPSQAALQSQDQEIDLWHPVKKLMTNRTFVLVLFAFAISLGIFCTISTVLNQLVLTYYPDGLKDAGRIGLLMIIAGFIGSLAGGLLLDRFKAYKGTLVTLLAALCATLICLTCIINIHIELVYVSVSLAGFLMGSIWSVSYEIVVEATYPEPEGISVGLLNGLGQAFGIGFTELYSALFFKNDALGSNIALALLAFLSIILAACVRMEFRREAANFKKNNDNLGFDETVCSKL